jgi:twinkle protein
MPYQHQKEPDLATKADAIEKAAQRYYDAFGEGGWIGETYIVRLCPLCNDEFTFMFIGLTGIWSCSGCKKSGTFAQLRDVLKEDLLWDDRFAALEQPQPPEGLIQLGQYMAPRAGQSIPTGFGELDKHLGGLYESALTILSGKRGQGKSTFASQLALNLIQSGAKVCFYSGELSTATFQHWVVKQAAGSHNLTRYTDDFGADRWYLEPQLESQIKAWLVDRFILYDNTITKSSERNSILDRFMLAKKYYQCNYYFVDNLMTAKYTKDVDRDYFRQQSNFAGELTDFAMQEKVHVVLVAHPRKGESGDLNDDVAGLSDITNRASNVLFLQRFTEDEVAKNGYDSLLNISKNRDYGAVAKIGMEFLKDCKRFVPISGTSIMSYAWEPDRTKAVNPYD